MSQPNPYETPRSQHPDGDLAGKARRLLERRDQPITLVRYLSENWRRHLVVAIAFGLLIAAAWQTGNNGLAVMIASFWTGRFVRDVQWFRTLAREWPSTKELLDWKKIEHLAA